MLIFQRSVLFFIALFSLFLPLLAEEGVIDLHFKGRFAQQNRNPSKLILEFLVVGPNKTVKQEFIHRISTFDRKGDFDFSIKLNEAESGRYKIYIKNVSPEQNATFVRVNTSFNSDSDTGLPASLPILKDTLRKNANGNNIRLLTFKYSPILLEGSFGFDFPDWLIP